ncbi:MULTISPECIES: Wadjet anti-phage system protein JetD domain-containing protein [unclassified Variovorax]|uniref:Wadjet anti-phage system protein JetD domain-containing protein n=1 Tax=unclassified Variovorax TaxID=663243 RepID=UPI001E49229B|nr:MULTISPECIES: Wadjet anti-phage system protein JetD domain-containing protein [unclassified Variovorax]
MASLLNLLVDRLDASQVRGSARTASLALSERTWPALYGAGRESDKEELWAHLCDMARWGWVAVKPEAALRSRSGYAMAPRLTVQAEADVRRAVSRLERPRSSLERWRAAVNEHLIGTPEQKAAVADFCIDIPNRDMAEVVKRLNALPNLVPESVLLREASSRLFWGMSKVLDKRQALVCAVLGVQECPFPESPVQLQVFLPPSPPSGVLFIENAMTFEQAVGAPTAMLEGLILAFASGFRGSAQRLRTAAGSSLYYSAKGDASAEGRARFEGWLYQTAGSTLRLPSYFWGDLDFAGMRILAALRASFPETEAWRPGYLQMLQALKSGGGHAPEAADKQGQRELQRTGCLFADAELIPAMSRTGQFVDQEAFRP